MKMKSLRSAWLLVSSLVASSALVHALPYTWTQNSAATQDWAAAGNWLAPNGVFVNGANELIFFANATITLANGANAITTNVPAAVSLNALTLNGRGSNVVAGNSTVNIASSASTWTLGDGTTSTVTLNSVYGLGGGTVVNIGALTYNVTANLTLNQANTTVSGNGNAVFHFTGNIGQAAAGYGITKTGSSVLSLSGTNAYTGASSITGGALVFRNTNAKAGGAATHAFGPGATLGLGVAAAGSFYSATDVDNAFAGTMTGNLAGITVDPATSIGLDTSDGNFTYGTSIGSVTRGLQKFGLNTLTLGGTNAYTGATAIHQGILEVSSLANAGVNSGIGAFPTAGAAGLLLQGGTLRYTGATATTDRGFTHLGTPYSGIDISGAGVALTMGASTIASTEALNITGGAGSTLALGPITAAAAQANFFATLPTTLGTFTFTSNMVTGNRGTSSLTYGDITGSGASTLFLASGTSGSTTVNGVISGFTGFLRVGGTSVNILGTNNSYTGATELQSGTLTFNSIKSVGAGNSSLGAPALAQATIQFGNGTNPIGLTYTGTGDTTDRVLNLRGTTGTITLSQSGTGLLKFTSNLTAAAGTKTLALSGSTAGTGELAGAIVNGSSGTVSLSKTGTGTWTLSGANTYTGSTTVNAGVLALVGGSQTSQISVTATGTLGFTLGSPTTSTSPVNFASGSKVAITGTVTSPTDYLLMTASTITGAPALVTPIPGYFLQTRNSGTELWLDFNPNIQTHVIDLGSGTTIVGGTFGSYTGPITGLPLPPFPAGTILRSVSVNVALAASDAGNFASDLTLLFDPTPGSAGGDFNLAFCASDATPPVFGTSNILAWPASANSSVIGTALTDFKAESAWTGLVGPIDISPGGTGLFLGNLNGSAPQGGTWSGTITLTYELPGSPPSAYDTWATDKGLTVANNAKNLDPDNDDRSNLAEFAFDGNPLSGVNDGKVAGKVGTVGGQQVLTLTLPVRTGALFSNSGGDQLSALIDGVVYRIEGDVNLSTFADTVTEVTGGDATAIQAGLPALASGWTYRTFRAPGTVPATAKAFLRAKVSETP